MAPPNNPAGCLSGSSHCFTQLFNKVKDLLLRRGNNNSAVQPRENAPSIGLTQEYHPVTRHSNSSEQDANQATPMDVDKVEGGSKIVVEASTKLKKEKTVEEFEQFLQFVEDECPTCLEEYSPENPKITTKCNHDFHLGCIYDWKERSDRCPVCYRVMVFEETT